MDSYVSKMLVCVSCYNYFDVRNKVSGSILSLIKDQLSSLQSFHLFVVNNGAQMSWGILLWVDNDTDVLTSVLNLNVKQVHSFI